MSVLGHGLPVVLGCVIITLEIQMKLHGLSTTLFLLIYFIHGIFRKIYRLHLPFSRHVVMSWATTTG